jgi:hypothetical protein
MIFGHSTFEGFFCSFALVDCLVPSSNGFSNTPQSYTIQRDICQQTRTELGKMFLPISKALT